MDKNTTIHLRPSAAGDNITEAALVLAGTKYCETNGLHLKCQTLNKQLRGAHLCSPVLLQLRQSKRSGDCSPSYERCPSQDFPERHEPCGQSYRRQCQLFKEDLKWEWRFISKRTDLSLVERYFYSRSCRRWSFLLLPASATTCKYTSKSCTHLYF